MIDDSVFISLEDLLDIWPSEKAEALFRTFKCERDPDVEGFLKLRAIEFHRKHLSRTYLVVSRDYTTVLAYMTLGIKCLEIPKDNRISRSISKEMNVYNGICQNYLLGQLGKADGVRRGTGKELIDYALSIIKASFKSLGCRTVRVDCKKDLIEFYEENGFRLVAQEEDGGDRYHMVYMF